MRAHLGTWLAIGALALLLTPLLLAWLPTPGDEAGEFTVSPPPSGSRLVRSVAVAATTATVALAIGLLLAYRVANCQPRYAAALGTLALIPFVCPHTVWALTQTYCYGPGGMLDRWLGDTLRPRLSQLNAGHYLSTVLVMAQIYAPFAMLFAGRGMQRLHQAGSEAAHLFLKPRRRLAWMIAALRAELAGVWCLIFALALGNFAVPHVLQCRLLVTDIYMRAANYLDHFGAIVASLPVIILCAGSVMAVTAFDSRTASPAGQVFKQPPSHRDSVTCLANLAATLYFILAVFLPIAALLYECQSVSQFVSAVRDAGPETRNTLVLATTVATLAVSGSVALRLMPSGWMYRLCAGVSFALIGVPSLIIALLYARSFSQLDAVGFELPRRFGIVVTCGLLFRVWPYVARAVADARRRHSPAWDEVASLSGLSGWRRWPWITLPTTIDYLLAGTIIAFVVAAGEIEICQMLCEPGQGTLTLRLFTFLHFGPTHVAASLALLQLLLTSIPVLVYFLICDRFLRLI
jgi:iron(III) transport system permease protein